MPALALFGITNDGLNLAVNVLVLCLVFIYLALIAWTYLDARRRIDDGVLIGCSVVLSVLPIAGPIIYSILRPPEFLEDQHERELEIRASELRLRQLEEQSCPNCAFPIERSYLRCPSCRARVKDPCESCGKPIEPRWALCPYCEAPNRQSAQPPARRAPKGARAPATRQAAPSAPPRRRRPAKGERKPADDARKPASKAPAPARAKKTATRQSGSRPARTGQQRAANTKEQPAAREDVPPPSPTGDGGSEERSRPAKT
ncbi:MAG: zinc ribbon domain-containing protein [bacterium]